jgi:hypothetical protein
MHHLPPPILFAVFLHSWLERFAWYYSARQGCKMHLHDDIDVPLGLALCVRFCLCIPKMQVSMQLFFLSILVAVFIMLPLF